MTREILDDPREESGDHYTQKAYRSAVIAWVLILTVFILSTINVALGHSPPHPIINIVMMIAFLASVSFGGSGFMASIRSFMRDEPSSFKKVISLIGNLIIVLFLLATIVANVLDFLG